MSARTVREELSGALEGIAGRKNGRDDSALERAGVPHHNPHKERR
jgi:hypothetical protein